MRLTSKAFKDMQPIPEAHAFCAIDQATHVKLSANRNPDLQWTDLPTGTKSLVLICHDPDVPSRPDDVNQEGRTVARTLPRVDFFHWVLIDLPADTESIAVGEFCEGVVAHGKPPVTSRGAREGINDYTGWFAGDNDMAGSYYGYDGPCPPWNDELPHRYVFTLYALDIARLEVEGAFRGDEVRDAMADHVLGQATLTGRYTLNPTVKL